MSDFLANFLSIYLSLLNHGFPLTYGWCLLRETQRISCLTHHKKRRPTFGERVICQVGAGTSRLSRLWMWRRAILLIDVGLKKKTKRWRRWRRFDVHRWYCSSADFVQRSTTCGLDWFNSATGDESRWPRLAVPNHTWPFRVLVTWRFCLIRAVRKADKPSTLLLLHGPSTATPGVLVWEGIAPTRFDLLPVPWFSISCHHSLLCPSVNHHPDLGLV